MEWEERGKYYCEDGTFIKKNTRIFANNVVNANTLFGTILVLLIVLFLMLIGIRSWNLWKKPQSKHK